MEPNQEYDMETTDQSVILKNAGKIILMIPVLGALGYPLTLENRITVLETTVDHILNGIVEDVKETRKDVKEINLYLRSLPKTGGSQ